MIVGLAGSYAMDFYILPEFEYNVGEMGQAWVVIGAREDEYVKQCAIVAHTDCDFGVLGFSCSRLACCLVGSGGTVCLQPPGRARCAAAAPSSSAARLTAWAAYRGPPGCARQAGPVPPAVRGALSRKGSARCDQRDRRHSRQGL